MAHLMGIDCGIKAFSLPNIEKNISKICLNG